MPADSDTQSDIKHLEQRIDSREALRALLPDIIRSAQRRISIFAPMMPATIYNQREFVQALASFVARHRRNSVHIAVEHYQQVLRENEYLIQTCRRLSDFIQMHKISERDKGRADLFIVIDNSGYLYQADTAQAECLINFNDAIRTAQYAKQFATIWDASEPMPGLHTVGI